jgi:multidrug efflux pump subunit AcrA (membrane-fusion protein)
MRLSDFQHRVLALLTERGDWVTTGDLLAALDSSPRELQRGTRQLSEEGLVVVAVASLDSGSWRITKRGSDVVHSSTK